MVTLSGQQVYEYLDTLLAQTRGLKEEAAKDSFADLANGLFGVLVEAERNFLQLMNRNTVPVLSIAPNGLPSFPTLNADLEKLCEIESTGPVAQLLRPRQVVDAPVNYVPLSEEQWSDALKKEDGLRSTIHLSLGETEEGRLQLRISEDLYRKGVDKFSMEVPILKREGHCNYHVVWNHLLAEPRGRFFLADVPGVLANKEVVKLKRFDDIERMYGFSKKDYASHMKRSLFLNRPVVPEEHLPRVIAGAPRRIAVTKSIIDALKKVYGDVYLQGVSKNGLDDALLFADMENVPLQEPSRFTLDDNVKFKERYAAFARRGSREFSLVDATGNPIGMMRYIVPFNGVKGYGGYGGVRHKMDWGGVLFKVIGTSIPSVEQYTRLQSLLDKKAIL